MIEEIVLIRHGETPGNRNRVVQTPDTPLSDRGIAQAERVAERVRRELDDGHRLVLLSSDYLRAHQTASIIARRCAVDVESEELLRERNFGHLRGQRYDDLRRQSIDPFAADYRPPGGEDWPTFDRRVGSAWKALRRRLVAESERPEPTVLCCVTHGLVLRRLVELHLELTDGVVAPERWDNTSVTRVAGAEPHAVRLLNCVAHLDSEALEEGSISGL